MPRYFHTLKFAPDLRLGVACVTRIMGATPCLVNSVVAVELVVTGSTDQQVVACGPQHVVVPFSAVQAVASSVSKQGVPERRPDHVLDTSQGIGAVARRGARNQIHGHRSFGERVDRGVVAGTTVDRIVPHASIEDVFSSARAQRVVAGATQDRVGAASPEEAVGPIFALRKLVVAVENVVAAASEDTIATGASVEQLEAALTAQEVASLFAAEKVGALAAAQAIVSAISSDDVVSAVPTNEIVPAPPDQNVVASKTDNDVSARRALELIDLRGSDDRGVLSKAARGRVRLRGQVHNSRDR
jgi:hypothetical protein